MTVKLDGPIPGQSLTREVGNAPWEQPPLYSDNNKALAWHIDNLNKGEHMDDLLFLLDQGFPLSTFVESLTTTAVMEGFHTIDTSTLINPVLHQYIKEMANAAQINLTEWDGPSEEEKQQEKYKQKLSIMLANGLNEPAPTPMTNEAPAEPMEQKAPQGIISRRY